MDEINQKKVYSFSIFSEFLNLLKEYSINKDKETENKIDNLIKENRNIYLPLPSNRMGSFLAVAIEMNEFVGALYLLRNSSRLEINSDNISYGLLGNDIWGIEEYIDRIPNNLLNLNIDELRKKYKDSPEYLEQVIKARLQNYNSFNVIKKMAIDKRKQRRDFINNLLNKKH